MSGPRPDRPGFTPGYGVSREAPAGQWADAAAKLERARNYWLATADPAGRPHAMPVWGLWLDGAFWFSTDPASRKGLNLAARTEVVVHLESGDDAVIVEGRAERVETGLEAFADAYERKYGIVVEPGPAFGIYRVAPLRAFTWTERDYPATATRWRWSG